MRILYFFWQNIGDNIPTFASENVILKIINYFSFSSYIIFLVSSLITGFITCFPEEMMLFLHCVVPGWLSFLITFESFGPFQSSFSASWLFFVLVMLNKNMMGKEPLLMSLLKVALHCDFSHYQTSGISHRNQSEFIIHMKSIHSSCSQSCNHVQGNKPFLQQQRIGQDVRSSAKNQVKGLEQDFPTQ